MYTLIGQWCLATGGAKVAVYTVDWSNTPLLGAGSFASCFPQKKKTGHVDKKTRQKRTCRQPHVIYEEAQDDQRCFGSRLC